MKFLCPVLLLSWLAVAQEIPVQLSPQEKERLRAERLGYPQPPAHVTNQYRMTASVMTPMVRTQVLALVTVTIVTTNDAVLVLKDGEWKQYFSSSKPTVISVVTNHYDLLLAPELKP